MSVKRYKVWPIELMELEDNEENGLTAVVLASDYAALEAERDAIRLEAKKVKEAFADWCEIAQYGTNKESDDEEFARAFTLATEGR